VFAVLAFFGLFTLYVLRVILSAAIIPMQKEFGWSNQEKGLALSSFFIGYLFLQVPGGWAATRYGGKNVYMASIVVPSILTMLTPLVSSSLPALAVMRILTGAGEAASYPSLHALIGRWAPKHERSTIVGIVWAGAYMGTTCAFPLAGALIETEGAFGGWRSVFYYSGAFGCLWGLVWTAMAASTPGEHSLVSKEERKYIESSLVKSYDGKGAVPWLAIASLPSMWAVCAQHFSHNWLLYLNLTWLPDYLRTELDFNMSKGGMVAVLPYLACFACSILAGYVAERMARAGVPLFWIRRLAQTLSEMVSAVALVLAGYSKNATLAVLCMTVSVGLSGMCSAGFGVNYLDLSPYYGGVLFGIGNTIATIPGIVAPLVAGAIIPTVHAGDPAPRAAWQEVFWIGFGVSIFGWSWWMIGARAELEPSISGPVEEESTDGNSVSGGGDRAKLGPLEMGAAASRAPDDEDEETARLVRRIDGDSDGTGGGSESRSD